MEHIIKEGSNTIIKDGFSWNSPGVEEAKTVPQAIMSHLQETLRVVRRCGL